VGVHPDAAQRRTGAGHHDGHRELHPAVITRRLKYGSSSLSDTD
jgi:hypothetical protein